MFQETLVNVEAQYRMDRANRAAEMRRWTRSRRAERRAAGRTSVRGGPDASASAVSGLALSASLTPAHELLLPAAHDELSPIEDGSSRLAADHVGV